jgi:hypothetical protein
MAPPVRSCSQVVSDYRPVEPGRYSQPVSSSCAVFPTPGAANNQAHRLRRMASTPANYSSGLVVILREPQAEHFMCVPINDTGVFQDSGSDAGSTSRWWPQSQQ